MGERDGPSAARRARPPAARSANGGGAASQNTGGGQWGRGREGGGARAEQPGGAAGRFEAPGRRGARGARHRPIGAHGARGASQSARGPAPRPRPPAVPPPPRGSVGGGARPTARRGHPRRGRRAPPRHVGEHGGAAAPGHDQPVRAGGRLRRRPGQAAAPGRALAVRDRPERLLPGEQRAQQPPPPPDDVHPQQHASHSAQLPGRARHVLQAAHVGEPAERRQPHGPRGLLATRQLQPLLGLVAPQPPARVAAALVAHRPRAPPPPAPCGARLAPRPRAPRAPAAPHGHDGWAEIRLGRPCAGGLGKGAGGWGVQRRGLADQAGAFGAGGPEKRTGTVTHFLGFILIFFFPWGEEGFTGPHQPPCESR